MLVNLELSANVIEVKLVAVSNVLFPMLVTLAGISMEVKLVTFLNALPTMLVTSSCMIYDVSVIDEG